MELSIFIAQLLSLIYLPLGIGMLNGQIKVKSILADFEDNGPLLILTGYIGMTLGLVIVTFHNNWVSDWTVLITIIGWIALIKVFLILAAPKTMFSLYKKIPINQNVSGVIALLFGLMFSYFGFVA